MFSSELMMRRGRMPILVLAMSLAFAGCESKMDKAIDQAKKQAATTGQPQQVVAVDKTGTTTTTVVQPPAKGQTTEAMTTSTTPRTWRKATKAFSWVDPLGVRHHANQS